MTVALRPANQVMRLERLGSFHASRLSFMRVLLRRIRAEQWVFKAPDWHVGSDGTGHAVYTVETPRQAYSLIAFAHDLPEDQRSDRVIAEAWDVTFTLFDGVPTDADVDRLRNNVPLQEAGRISASEITMSRANRSSRVWNHVVERLANGQQPDADILTKVGYLMRTTAVYGSGKFGAVDYEQICDRPEFSSAFQAEMLTVYLIRQFVFDLVEHAARLVSPDAVPLSDEFKRFLGIGNSTGLGMAPFLVNHPELLHRWIAARETAIARVRSVETISADKLQYFNAELDAAIQNADQWIVDDELQMNRINALRDDLRLVQKFVMLPEFTGTPFGWDRLITWSEPNLGLEAQEQIASLIFEPYAELVDDLALDMKTDAIHAPRVNGRRNVHDLAACLKQNYGWALGCDFTCKTETARFWYVSEEKLEPRLGERFEEEGADLERPLAIGRDICALLKTLRDQAPDQTVAEFLMAFPEHRSLVRRIEICENNPYSEIQDNLLAADMRPIDMLRCKLSFFGATRFDPRSDRWVRICMFQNAPLISDLTQAKTHKQAG